MNRLAVLSKLIDARWGDWPASRIPADVLADAEAGRMPRRCNEPLPSIVAVDQGATCWRMKPRRPQREIRRRMA